MRRASRCSSSTRRAAFARTNVSHPRPELTRENKEKYAMPTTRRSQRPGRFLHLGLIPFSVLAAANPVASAPDDLATKFQINDANPAANLPSVEDANENPLEFGYMIQDLIARGEG